MQPCLQKLSYGTIPQQVDQVVKFTRVLLEAQIMLT